MDSLFEPCLNRMTDEYSRGTTGTPLAIIADRNQGRATQAAALLAPRYTVILVGTQKALQGLLLREKPAIIIIDDDISPSGGLSLIADIKSAATATFKAVLVIDQNSPPPASSDTLKAKLDGVLIRPFTRAHFLGVISELRNLALEQSWDRLPALQKTALTNSLTAYRSVEAILDPAAPAARPARPVFSVSRPLTPPVLPTRQPGRRHRHFGRRRRV